MSTYTSWKPNIQNKTNQKYNKVDLISITHDYNDPLHAPPPSFNHQPKVTACIHIGDSRSCLQLCHRNVLETFGSTSVVSYNLRQRLAHHQPIASTLAPPLHYPPMPQDQLHHPRLQKSPFPCLSGSYVI